MDLLLHTCCGPCLTGVLKYLIDKGYNVTPLWFNPNVMPYREYKKRLGAFREVCERYDVEPIIIDEYDLNEILHNILVPIDNRCGYCYRYRLNRTARLAKERGIGAFSTTLLQSPYQQHDVIAVTGDRAAEKNGINFLYEDLRNQYSKSKEITREMGIYSQGYCGCIYSEEERYRK